MKKKSIKSWKVGKFKVEKLKVGKGEEVKRSNMQKCCQINEERTNTKNEIAISLLITNYQEAEIKQSSI